MQENGTGNQHALSNREREVLALMAEGLSHKETAGKLFISPETVRKHLRNIYAKLEVNNKVAAINKLRNQILHLEDCFVLGKK